MPRRKLSDSVADLLATAEELRSRLDGLPVEVRQPTKDLALAIVSRSGKRRGRPPGRRVV